MIPQRLKKQRVISDIIVEPFSNAGGYQPTLATIGGVVGEMTDSTCNQCSAKVSIQGNVNPVPVVLQNGDTRTPDLPIGGIVGNITFSLTATTNSTITRSFATGSITTNAYQSGGIVGYVDSTAANISNNWSAMTTIQSNKYAGGIVGQARVNVMNQDTKNIAVVSTVDAVTGAMRSIFNSSPATQFIGAFTGFARNTASVPVTGINYLYSNEVSTIHQTTGSQENNVSTHSSTSSAGLTNAQAVLQASYPALDFVNDWSMTTKNEYAPNNLKMPVLKWQCSDPKITCAN
jgi:hypothetical protein